MTGFSVITIIDSRLVGGKNRMQSISLEPAKGNLSFPPDRSEMDFVTILNKRLVGFISAAIPAIHPNF